jgi:hypothetical protein
MVETVRDIEVEVEVESRSAQANRCREDSRGKSRNHAYLRPNLLYTRKFVIVHLLFLLPRRSDGPAGTKTTVNVLLFLLRWFQDLRRFG